MELRDVNSELYKINKLLENIKREYNIKLTESNLDEVIIRNKRRLDYMIENIQDTMSNNEYTKSRLVYNTAVMVKQLLEYNSQYRVDSKTGAILNYVKPGEGQSDSSVAARPDLYWREQDGDTADSVVIPMPLSYEELAIAAANIGTKIPDVQLAGGTGMYVGIETPGAQATVINAKNGKNKVAKAGLTKTGVVKTTHHSQESQTKNDGTDAPDGIFTNMRGSKADKYQTQIKSPISGTHDAKRMNENMAKGNHILMLAESEIEKAQIVMAVHNEIVEKMQRDAEKMSNMKVDILGPIVERIKAEHGLAPAENFRDTITRLLDQALDVVMQVKDQINTETLKLTGDISSAPSIEQDLGANAAMAGGDANLGGLGDAADLAGADFEFGDGMSDDVPEMEPLPAEREMKESKQHKIGVVLESKSGKQGKKYFTDVTEMRTWLGENKSKIAKVHKILKD